MPIIRFRATTRARSAGPPSGAVNSLFFWLLIFSEPARWAAAQQNAGLFRAHRDGYSSEGGR